MYYSINSASVHYAESCVFLFWMIPFACCTLCGYDMQALVNPNARVTLAPYLINIFCDLLKLLNSKVEQPNAAAHSWSMDVSVHSHHRILEHPPLDTPPRLKKVDDRATPSQKQSLRSVDTTRQFLRSIASCSVEGWRYTPLSGVEEELWVEDRLRIRGLLLQSTDLPIRHGCTACEQNLVATSFYPLHESNFLRHHVVNSHFLI